MPVKGNPVPWIRKAEQDYEAAIALARRRKRPVADVVCFHAQQCAEKYLKAFLAQHRLYFPKTHDLAELLNLAVPWEPSLELLRPFVTPLTPYAVSFRYPDEQAAAAEARRALTCVRRAREHLRQVLRLRMP